MAKFTPAQNAAIRKQLSVAGPASELTTSLRATLASAAQGAKADAALAGVADLAAVVAAIDTSVQPGLTVARFELRLPSGTPGGALAVV